MSLSDLTVRTRQRFVTAGTRAALLGFTKWVWHHMRPDDRPDIDALDIRVSFGAVSPKLYGKVGRMLKRAPKKHRVHIGWEAMKAGPVGLAYTIVHELRHVRDHAHYVALHDNVGKDEFIDAYVEETNCTADAHRAWVEGRRKQMRILSDPRRAEAVAMNAERRFAIDVTDHDIKQAFDVYFRMQADARIWEHAARESPGGYRAFNKVVPRKARTAIPPPLLTTFAYGTPGFVPTYTTMDARHAPEVRARYAAEGRLLPDAAQPRWIGRRDRYGDIKYETVYPRDPRWRRARKF